MEEKVFIYIRKHQMIQEGDCVVAGISGGADSVCLLFLLEALRERLGFSLEAVHVEHGIRGEESLADARFTEQLCRGRGIPFHLYTCDVPQRAAEEKLSMEEAARKCRYEAFEEVCAGKRQAKIAVAHNRDDQAETILWNLARGSGLRGMCGMRPVNGKVIRPLLGISREEIEGYLQKQGQGFCTDSTNLSDGYTRNRLRRNILPGLEAGVNRQARMHIAQAGERLRRAQEYLEGLAARRADEISEYCGEELRVSAKDFCREEEVMQEYMLRIWLDRLGAGMKDVGAVHLEEIKRLASGQPGRRLELPGGRRVRRTGGYLAFDMEKEAEECREEAPLAVPGESRWGKYRITASLEPNKNQNIPEKKYTKWLDYDTIKNTIQLRSRKSGDYFIADGGHRKLKKYFIDEKVLREDRNKVLLLADGSHILWVVGFRISEMCKVTEHTKTILKIHIMEEEDYGR
ncbi:tRNA lysidine(34) synthetase TilS [Lachnospiraceae bacterium 46-15]